MHDILNEVSVYPNLPVEVAVHLSFLVFRGCGKRLGSALSERSNFVLLFFSCVPITLCHVFKKF